MIPTREKRDHKSRRKAGGSSAASGKIYRETALYDCGCRATALSRAKYSDLLWEIMKWGIFNLAPF